MNARRTLPASLLSLAFVAAAALPAAAHLRAGTQAPEFAAESATGGAVAEFDLEAALRKGPVVVYFFPKAFTSGCTVEAHAFSQHINDFKKLGATVIGISGDDIETQKKFSTQECRAKFAIASDPKLKIAKSYDATVLNMFANRTSYVIAPGGKIVESLTDGEPLPHIENALKALAELKASK
ncbi:MAG: peroxiredoxin [Candidatus Velthaea sp.]